MFGFCKFCLLQIKKTRNGPSNRTPASAVFMSVGHSLVVFRSFIPIGWGPKLVIGVPSSQIGRSETDPEPHAFPSACSY